MMVPKGFDYSQMFVTAEVGPQCVVGEDFEIGQNYLFNLIPAEGRTST